MSWSLQARLNLQQLPGQVPSTDFMQHLRWCLVHLVKSLPQMRALNLKYGLLITQATALHEQKQPTNTKHYSFSITINKWFKTQIQSLLDANSTHFYVSNVSPSDCHEEPSQIQTLKITKWGNKNTRWPEGVVGKAKVSLGVQSKMNKLK